MVRALAGFVGVALLLTGCANSSGAPAASVLERSPFHRGADNAVVRVVTDRRVVALTFDDGPSARYTPRVLRALARAGARAIERVGAPAPAYSRPPWGDFDQRVAVIAAAQGRPLIGWDLALDKELHGRDLADGVRRLVARVRRGSIILAHDGRGLRDRTLAALPLLLEQLRARGFETVTVSELIDGAGRAARDG